MIVAFGWVFSGWPQIYDFPPRIPIAYAATVAKPVITLAAGSYTGIQTTTITDSTGGATICYTTDGTTPTAPTAGTCSGGTTQTYSSAITISSSETIKAIGTKSHDSSSSVASSAYTITVDTPTFGTNGGSFANDTSSTISDAFTGAAICYTTDGTTPTAPTAGTCSGGTTQTYSGAVPVTVTGTVLKAIGTIAGATNSAVAASSAFTLTVGAITSSPGAGTYSGTQSVTLNIANTTGATAHYTTDGSAVSCSSTAYSGAFNVSLTTTVNAIGCKTNYISDSAISDVYTIIVPPTVTTSAASSVTDISAVLNGNITATGGANATVRGFAWGTNSALSGGTTATTTNDTGSFGTGAFNTNPSPLTGLTCNTTYYYRAYATNSAGDGLGSIQTFTTSACTVISITVTSSGTISYGTLAAGVSSSTVPAYTQTIKNDGTGSEAFNIEGQNTACPWTLAGTTGTDQYKQEFSTNGGSSWTALTTSYQTMVTGVAANGTQTFDLRLTTPTATSCYTQQSADVTIQAVAG